MTDMLLEVGRRRIARRMVEALRLPVPLPAVLERATGPWQRRELAGRAVGTVGFHDDALAEPFARMLAEAGARVTVVDGSPAAFERAGEAFGAPMGSPAAFQRAGEAFGAPTGAADSARASGPSRIDGLIVDATRAGLAELVALHGRLQAHVAALGAGGRLIVLADGATEDPARAAVAAALEGFMRSAAKELGRRGTTAQLIAIEPGGEARAAAIARFVLSARSAFVTAQPLRATTTAADQPLDYVRALDRKVALVTGAARGIGEATARRLAEEGARVVCVDHPGAERELAAVATAIGGELVVADLADAAAAARIAERVAGGLDIVVHNAGITRDRTFAKMSGAQWTEVLEVNLGAVLRLTEALAIRDRGRIVCLSSVAGIAGNVGQTSYAASKAGTIGLVEALARRLAPRGITANAIAPGFIETRMTAAIPFAIREAARRLSALGQGGQPRDVAEAIAFLAQPASAGLTGAVLRVCGGALIGA